MLDWNGCLPREAIHSKIQCKCVFSSTGWTQRSLTVGELTAAFDVPRPMATHLPTLAIEVGNSFGHPSATPTKLLSKILHNFLTTPKASPHQANSSSEGLTAEMSQGPKNPVGIPANLGVCHPSHPTTRNSAGPTPAKKDYAIAVKADEAEAPIELWNDRIWAGVKVHGKTTLSHLYDKQVGQPQIPVPFGHFKRGFSSLVAALSLPVLLLSHAVFLRGYLDHQSCCE